MKSTSAAVLIALLGHVTAQENSEVFSQYFGAATVTAPAASSLQHYFTACTNFCQAQLIATSASGLVASMIPLLEYQQAGEVCELCTGLSIARVDSCCAVSSSIDCFAAFAPSATVPASTPATTTGRPATTSGSGSSGGGGGDGDSNPNSQVFSQYFGAATVTAPAASSLQLDFTACTNFGHALQAYTGLTAAASMIPQIEQQQADGVCQLCTGLSIARIDSCCAQSSSVACFDAFATAPATTAPVNTTAATTGPSGAVTTGGTAAPTTSTNAGNRAEAVGPLAMVILGAVSYLL